ncbi:MAG: GNAT family N-acetyltransferase [Planctomycetales bacterium]
MNIVLQRVKRLTVQPLERELPPGWIIRNHEDSRDNAAWLRLRELSFADEKPAVRPWTAADFQREFLSKPWWEPQRMWFAEIEGEPVGTVALADRSEGIPAVHWLAVLPERRRQGIAELLMNRLERFCWERNRREIHLETHRDWKSAVQFYEALGYRSG